MEGNTVAKGKIRLYLCGGGATNIGKYFESDRGRAANGFGEIDSVYVDTSSSNIDTSIPSEAVYLLKNVDGSGKIRKENAAEIGNVIKDVLQAFPPLDFNIVLSTTSGGSGSVIAPMLTKELLGKKRAVIVLGVGSVQDKLEIDNNLKTFKSYDAIARQAGVPVVMAYAQNGDGRNRAEVDVFIQEMISGLSVLFSRENQGLDTRDLGNWADYVRATSYEPKLVSLHMVSDPEGFNQIGNVITVASLSKEGEEVELPLIPDYRCHGFSSTAVIEKAPVHFVVAEGRLIESAEAYEQQLATLSEQQAARVKNKGIFNANDEADASGLVF